MWRMRLRRLIWVTITVLDPWHLEAYGVESTNYNRDVENFAIMKRIIEKMVPPGDPMTLIKSPTDMGVNMANQGIIDEEACCEASRQEIIRRLLSSINASLWRETPIYDTLERMDRIMNTGLCKSQRIVLSLLRLILRWRSPCLDGAKGNTRCLYWGCDRAMVER